MITSLCCICSNELSADNSAACKCGHTFHHNCISHWISIKPRQTCPQCRAANPQPVKLFFDTNLDNSSCEEDVSTLKNSLLILKTKLKKAEEAAAQAEQQFFEQIESLEKAKAKSSQLRSSNEALKQQLQVFSKRNTDSENAIEEAKVLRNKLKSFVRIEDLIDKKDLDIKSILESYSIKDRESFTDIAKALVCLRSEYERLKTMKKMSSNANLKLKAKYDELAQQVMLSTSEIDELTGLVKKKENEIQTLNSRIEAFKNIPSSDCLRSNIPGEAQRILFESPMADPSFETSSKREKLSRSTKELDSSTDDFLKGLKLDTCVIRDVTNEPSSRKSHRLRSDKVKHLNKKSNGDALGYTSSAVKRGYDGLGGRHKLVLSEKSVATNVNGAKQSGTMKLKQMQLCKKRRPNCSSDSTLSLPFVNIDID